MSMASEFSSRELAASYRSEVRARVKALGQPLRLCGLIAEGAGKPSRTYARYTRNGCEDVGIQFVERIVPRLRIEEEVERLNADETVHGVMIYYPIFGTQQDVYLKDMICPEKDIEGLSRSWIKALYQNVRYVDGDAARKAVVPCTPLAIMKILEALGVAKDGAQGLRGKTVSVFNRSEVVGRPLASMMANDGARVFSFDLDGPQLFKDSGVSETSIDRAEALSLSEIVVTGVPKGAPFELIGPAEIRAGACCVNFSTGRNFAPRIVESAGAYVRRVGPVTVAMCLRNTLRLFENFHSESA